MASLIVPKIKPRSSITPREPLSSTLKTAKELLRSAHNTAEQILSDAQVEIEQQKNCAFHEGYTAGVQHAVAELLNRNQTLRDALSTAKDEIFSIAIELAERIVDDHIAGCPETIISRINDALTLCNTSKQCVIRVNPEDEALLNTSLTLNDTMCSLVADATIKKGSARLETDLGCIETSTRNQLTAIAAFFREKHDKWVN